MRLRLVIVLGAALLAAAALGGDARADGDPASDVLYMQDVYLPYTAPSKQAADDLRAAMAKADAAGYRIKVAVIASRFDLGTAGALLGQPNQYARFLGAEIQFFYHAHLLVVMPGGSGIYYDKHDTALPEKLLRGLKAPGRKPDDLAEAAATAVALLAAKDTSKPRWHDIYPPNGQPVSAFGRVGKLLKLEYFLYDDSLRASANVDVVSTTGKSLLHRARPLGAANGSLGTLLWSPPAAYAHKAVRLCITAKDPSGNVSPRNCVSLKLP